MSPVANKFNFILSLLKSWHMKRVESASNAQAKAPKIDLIDCYNSASKQDPDSTSWNTLGDDHSTKAPHPGLQMLSDAAMGKNTSAQSPTPAANASLTANANGSHSGEEMTAMATLGPITPGAGGAMMDFGFNGPDFDNFGFSFDDLNAMMDEQGWLNSGMGEMGGGASGGWAL